MKLLPMVLCSIAVTTPALAEPTAAQRAKVEALWQQAFDEWSPIFTCGSLIADSDRFVRKIWSKQRDDALASMELVGWPKPELDSYRAKADPDAMRLPPATPFADVVAYCDARPDWLKSLQTFTQINLSKEVERVLPQGSP